MRQTGNCWIVQFGLQSNLVDWIVFDNPYSKSDLGFGLPIQFLHFNPNPQKSYFLSMNCNFMTPHIKQSQAIFKNIIF